MAVGLLVAAGAWLAFEPWHGPIVMAISEQHGLDAADLPVALLLAVALAVAQPRARSDRRWWWGVAVTIVVGAVLMVGVLDPRIGGPLVPAGGGTFGGNTEHTDGTDAEPVDRWTHLAVTYDGSSYRLYVDGAEASSAAASGPIRHTTDPLWIGGNRPYGEYFRGVIDEARVYRRALTPAQLRAAMSTPVARGGPDARSLVAAYAFDGAGRTVRDDSGHGNTGVIRGASWTSAGRFGRGLSFDAAGQVVRVPASPSLNLESGMTLMAWIRPSEHQSGWRTVLARQTDAYFLAAGGGRESSHRLEQIDGLRFLLLLVLFGSLGWFLARGHSPWVLGGRRWYWPVGLLVAGSLVDVLFDPSDTMIGLALVAAWAGATAPERDERVSMYALGALFAAVTIWAIADQDSLPLPSDAGGVVRAAGLGLLLVTAGLLSLRHQRRAKEPAPGPR